MISTSWLDLEKSRHTNRFDGFVAEDQGSVVHIYDF